MENIINKMKETPVLASKDIIRLRSYIESKHAEESKSFRADKLAQSIHKIIDAHLHTCNKVEKQQIRSNLIEQHLLQNRSTITKHNIFSELIELDAKQNQILSRLEKWLAFHGYPKIQEMDLLAYVKDHRNTTFEITAQTLETIKASKNLTVREQKSPVQFFSSIPFRYISGFSLLILIFISFITYFSTTTRTNGPTSELTVPMIQENLQNIPLELHTINNNRIPEYFRYQNISRQKLKIFLQQKNSKLLQKDYLDTLYLIADEYQINPLLLLAIIGHEQGFVPEKHSNAALIINNPYNVFGSWQEYNTNFEDSSRIAAKTILTSLENRPENADPFQWMNKTYAEDQYWWKDVKLIFKALQRELSESH